MTSGFPKLERRVELQHLQSFPATLHSSDSPHTLYRYNAFPTKTHMLAKLRNGAEVARYISTAEPGDAKSRFRFYLKRQPSTTNSQNGRENKSAKQRKKTTGPNMLRLP